MEEAFREGGCCRGFLSRCCCYNRRLTGVDVGTGAEEDLCELHVAVVGGVEEGREAVVI